MSGAPEGNGGDGEAVRGGDATEVILGRVLGRLETAVVAADARERIVLSNPAAHALFGPEAASGGSLRVLLEALGVPMDRVRRGLEEGATWSDELRLPPRNGRRPWVRLSVDRGSGEEALAFMLVATDETQRRETEVALRERVKELRLLHRASEILNDFERPLAERLRTFVAEFPSGWLDPEATRVRLTLEGRVFESEDFRASPWMLTEEIDSGDVDRGRIEVALLRDPSDGEGDPFLPEEHTLLGHLARLLGDVRARTSSARLLAQTFASLRDAVLVIDSRADGRGIRAANRAAERIFGFERGALVGRSTESLHVDRESFLRFAEVGVPELERTGFFHGAFSMRRQDGTVFQAEQTVSLLDPPRGLEGGVVSVVRDITDRVEAERRRRESDERFRQLAEHIDDVFWVSDPEGTTIEYVSPAYTTVWGESPGTLRADPTRWVRAIVPEDRDRVLSAMALRGGAPWEHTYRIRRPDGEERWILDRSFPVTDVHGTVTRIVGVAKDITEQKRMEDRFGILSREITDVLNVLDRDGTVQTISPSVHGAMGYLSAEVEGRNALEFVHPEDRAAVRARLDQVARQKDDSVRAEYRVLTRSGEVRHVESVARNLLDDPAIAGILVTTRDVTERLALERRVRQMQKLESIGRLAGGIAHDFNNLLTVIQSQTELLLMETPSGPLSEDLGVIQAAAERAAGLTSQLLAFSRDQVLRPRVVDLNRRVRSTGKLLERILGEGIRIRYELASELPAVRVDPGQFEQVLLNLAVNARDAMPEGGELRIVSELEVPDPAATGRGSRAPAIGPWVRLTVSDTGVGMSDEVLQNIFEPFFTTKPLGRGTGLGLAMVYGTVTQSGGDVWAESTPGKGTSMILRFPAADGPAEEEVSEGPEPEGAKAPDREPRSAHAGGASSGRAGAGAARGDAEADAELSVEGTLLVVEDEAPVRQAIERVLARAGIEVEAVPDAEAALARLEAGTEAVALLTDLALPGMPGQDLVREARRLRPELPIVVMSGYADSASDGGRELPEGVDFLPKPFSAPDLVNAARNAILAARSAEA